MLKSEKGLIFEMKRYVCPKMFIQLKRIHMADIPEVEAHVGT